jgi:ankyrin repeat protein
MRNYLRYLLYLFVFIGFSSTQAGSYDDFFIAIKRDDAATITQLLQRGFDPGTPDPSGQPALLVAVKEPSINAAKALIAWPKTKVEVRNAADESPLMLASLKGLDDVVAALIKRGADVNKTGWTPLHYAATHGHLNVMKQLLEAHAYIDAESPNGTTPLMMAAHYGTPAAVKLLLESGADTTLKNQQNLTAVDFARRNNRTESADLILASVRSKQPRGTW